VRTGWRIDRDARRLQRALWPTSAAGLTRTNRPNSRCTFFWFDRLICLFRVFSFAGLSALHHHAGTRSFRPSLADVLQSCLVVASCQKTVASHIANLARVLVSRRHPVLLQVRIRIFVSPDRRLIMYLHCSKRTTPQKGPTSSGKTSLVEYMALRTGHKVSFSFVIV
jgi:hypothetical protein